MKISWKGKWNKGQIELETEKPNELIEAMNTLSEYSKIEESVMIGNVDSNEGKPSIGLDMGELPQLDSNLGISDAVRCILTSSWGKAKPRTMAEINEVLKNNALYFSSNSLSGVLTTLTKKNDVRRVKEGSRWAYIGK